MPAEDFDRVGSLLGDVCDAAAAADRAASGKEPAAGSTRQAGGKAQSDDSRVLAAAWPDIVGADVAANARPTRLSQGRLVVSTSSSVWAHTLTYMESDIRQRLNERLGPDVVEQIVFRHAGWEERPPGPAADPPASRLSGPGPLSEHQREALGKVEDLALPAELRDRILRAMTAAFVRGEQDFVR